ncbi:CPXCG motif-containing cysteine-rich protein [Gemmatimonas sp.]|uniref:CPXCG motif-containing cysteine-rich protein n=1 Tax=Gemmatimonas sp. TaxID=1962908 RepID=UPI0037C0D918
MADLSGRVSCPYCGESVEITLDPGGGANQQYIEDCQVCCRPWVVSVSYDEDGTAHVFVDASDDHDEHDD